MQDDIHQGQEDSNSPSSDQHGLELMGILGNVQHLAILPNLFSLFICPLVYLYMQHNLTGAFIYF